jgi:hypothetical protein
VEAQHWSKKRQAVILAGYVQLFLMTVIPPSRCTFDKNHGIRRYICQGKKRIHKKQAAVSSILEKRMRDVQAESRQLRIKDSSRRTTISSPGQPL